MLFLTTKGNVAILVACLFLLVPQFGMVARANAEPPAGRIAGLYLYMSPTGPNTIWNSVYEYALSQNYIDGMAIVVKWSDIEPHPNVYDWSPLDRWILEAVRLKKKMAIGVVAGTWTPAWLYNSGVPDISFSNYDRSPPSGLCETLHQPAVWAPAFLRAYGSTMAELSKHLRELSVPQQPPGAAYAALRIIKLSGINVTTEELRLNAQPPGGPCRSPNSALIWTAAGYRPAKVINAWMTIARATEAAFPDKIMSVAVIHKFAFPAINENGEIDDAEVIAPVAPDPMTVQILSTAVPVFKGKLMVQWNALSQFTRPDGTAVLPQEVLNAGQQGALVGWQLNGFLGVWGGTGCIYAPFHIEPCKTPADFESIFTNGIDHGASYLEIHPINVDSKLLRLPPGAINDHAAALEEAHHRLIDLP